jgi:pyruvate dehydrogenase E2 component (dihydrolipoamide acetyltransferase)
MSVSVSMPQLGESVTEGTVTRWLKKEGERVEADEPLLEVSTDKVDTEIPSPVSGVLRGITVAEDETVAVGAELAVIDETADGAAGAAAPPAEAAPGQAPPAEAAPGQAPAAEAAQQQPQAPAGQEYPPAPAPGEEPGPEYEPAGQPAGTGQAGHTAESVFTPVPPAEQPPAAQPAQAEQAPPQQAEQPPPTAPPAEQPAAQAPPQQAEQPPPAAPSADGAQPAAEAPPAPPAEAAPPAPPPQEPAAPATAAPAAPPAAPAATAPPPPSPEPAAPGAAPTAVPVLTTADGPYVTPLVRKLATEHGVDLAAVTGTGVGGRIRKQDVLDAARAARAPAPAAAAPAPAAAAPAAAPAAAAPAATAPPATAAPAPTGTAAPPAAAAASARAVVPSSLRGTTERMSRARQVIARRMVESLQTSAQLTTVVEADVTEIARLRERAKADFEAREGVKLSFLPFFALATVEALKVHPKLNAIIDTEAGQVTYHDAEHLGIAVDTERGLMVPVIQNAGDLNIGGLARKIADLAARTRAGQVSPDDLAGGTFTLTNTGSRKALFDTPIINQPQVGILGTGAVVKRPVVVEDPALGEVITVRSMVYLALTYDHRLVDGADAARFLATVKDRLEEGEFEAELGL